MSSTKNDTDIGSNYKDFLEFASTIITTCITAYTAISITDKYLSYLPGSIQEKERLEKEKQLEKIECLDGLKVFGHICIPKKWITGLRLYNDTPSILLITE